MIIDIYIFTLGFEVGANAGTNTTTASLSLAKLDAADLIVPVLSTRFMAEPDLVDGLQVAINRHRYCKGSRTNYLTSSDIPVLSAV